MSEYKELVYEVVDFDEEAVITASVTEGSDNPIETPDLP